MPTVVELVSDLADEHADLERVLGGLTPEQFGQPSASVGWTVADQVGHLTYFDRAAALAITDENAFKNHVSKLLEDMLNNGTDSTLAEFRSMPTSDVLRAWRRERAALIEASATLDDHARLAWYGPEMGAKSFLTARLMETWAHGLDICSAVGATRAPTRRLKHIAQLGIITRAWSYINRGITPNETPVRVTLLAPAGDTWNWGDDDAAESIVGPAEAFCQVVTQRRHPADTDLVISGQAAVEWMELAQAFAGGATHGPAPEAAE